MASWSCSPLFYLGFVQHLAELGSSQAGSLVKAPVLGGISKHDSYAPLSDMEVCIPHLWLAVLEVIRCNS